MKAGVVELPAPQAEQVAAPEPQKPSVDFDSFRKLFIPNVDGWQKRDFDEMVPGFADLAGFHTDGTRYFRVWLERARGCSKTFDVAILVA